MFVDMRIVGFARRLMAVAVLTTLIPSASAVWINEFHYDNTGSDIGESIEVAGVAGTDLTGWTLVLYNGSDGATYGSSIGLTGVLPDLSNGFGVLNLSVSGLQNGSPDGFALVDPTSAVIQFLSYEGSFTATAGPANGMISTDVGVSESSSLATGMSLQLIGDGSSYADFSWTGPVAWSPGSVNAGQTFSVSSPDPGPSVGVPDAGSSLVLFSVSIAGFGMIFWRRQTEVG
jgi:hypothetical protein